LVDQFVVNFLLAIGLLSLCDGIRLNRS